MGGIEGGFAAISAVCPSGGRGRRKATGHGGRGPRRAMRLAGAAAGTGRAGEQGGRRENGPAGADRKLRTNGRGRPRTGRGRCDRATAVPGSAARANKPEGTSRCGTQKRVKAEADAPYAAGSDDCERRGSNARGAAPATGKSRPGARHGAACDRRRAAAACRRSRAAARATRRDRPERRIRSAAASAAARSAPSRRPRSSS